MNYTGARSTLLATLLCTVGVQAAPQARIQLLVKPKASMPEAALHALLHASGGQEDSTIPALDVRVITVPAVAAAKLLEALQRNADIEYAEADQVAHAFATSNDPYAANQWYFSKIEASQAWDITTGSTALTVAVIDSGVLASHPDLQGKVLAGYDFVNNDADATDDNGHGTSVAGVCAASSNNLLGVTGVAWSNPILPVKVLGADGSGNHSGIANGITWAADRGVRVINLSLGGTTTSTTLQNAINYAWSKGAVIIAAAGNNGNNVPSYPAACQNVIAVSATDLSDGRPTWSNYGSYVDISAPGADIVTLSGADGYASWNGTSFSCPVASGVVALMRSVNPQLSNQSIVNLLLANNDDIGTAGYDEYFGQGRVNARRAVAAARGPLVVDSTAPVVAIGSPASGATVAGTVAVSLSGTDNVAVTRVELYVDGVLLGQSDSSSATFSWNTANTTDGPHVLEARAYDLANNAGTTSISVSVRNSVVADTIAPTATITSPGEGTTLAKSAKITVVSSDNVKVTRVELYIDGTLFSSSTSATPTFTWNTSRVAKGNHTLQAYAFDAAGNIGGSYTVTVRK